MRAAAARISAAYRRYSLSITIAQRALSYRLKKITGLLSLVSGGSANATSWAYRYRQHREKRNSTRVNASARHVARTHAPASRAIFRGAPAAARRGRTCVPIRAGAKKRRITAALINRWRCCSFALEQNDHSSYGPRIAAPYRAATARNNRRKSALGRSGVSRAALVVRCWREGRTLRAAGDAA